MALVESVVAGRVDFAAGMADFVVDMADFVVMAGPESASILAVHTSAGRIIMVFHTAIHIRSTIIIPTLIPTTDIHTRPNRRRVPPPPLRRVFGIIAMTRRGITLTSPPVMGNGARFRPHLFLPPRQPHNLLPGNREQGCANLKSQYRVALQYSFLLAVQLGLWGQPLQSCQRPISRSKYSSRTRKLVKAMQASKLLARRKLPTIALWEPVC